MEINPAHTWPAEFATRKAMIAHSNPIATSYKRTSIKLSKRIDAHPDSADLYRQRAMVSGSEGAVADIAIAREKGSTHPELDLILAQAYFEGGAYTKAQAAAATYQQRFPMDARPLIISASADLARKKGEHPAHCRNALVMLNRALALDSTNFAARVMHAYALTNTNYFAAGIAEYRRILTVAPHNPQVHFFLAEAYISAGNLTAACAHLAQATEYAELTVNAYIKAYCR